MTQLPLVFLGGLLGSAHCVGMCGGFAVAIGLSATTFRDCAIRQTAYSAGRIFTYAFFGVAAGWGGFWLSSHAGLMVNVQAALALLAGALLLYQGLLAAGLLPRFARGGSRGGVACAAAAQFRTILASPRRQDVFLAGMLNGFVPCGLLYGYVALAAASADMRTGALTMIAFGAGTLPVMLLTGLGSAVIPHQARRRVFQVAAACVVVLGVLSLYRGVQLLRTGAPAKCPACAANTTGLRQVSGRRGV